jgi:hypothetical protein
MVSAVTSVIALNIIFRITEVCYGYPAKEFANQIAVREKEFNFKHMKETI